ncbi:MAG: hypothetical protein IJT97_03820 [Bacteroidaceae bacterium]|nr:hypothetical protein [Bacteroidaceae bacterium]
MKKIYCLIAIGLPLFFASCSSEDADEGLGTLVEGETQFGVANDVFSAEEWYPGGQLGTTENKSYSDPVPSVNVLTNGQALFKHGEDFFEHLYTYSQEPRKGLGPAWVRSSCIHCHPSYGHGKRQTEYKANTIGNGYLLVVYHPNEAFTSDGVRYTTFPSSYFSEVTGMPQTQAMAPFKAPIDESGIHINWQKVESMPSGLPLQFPDGEAYELIYPEITIDQVAFNTNPKPVDYEVRLESTIGIYGTGLLDAISPDDMKAQYAAEAPYVQLNPNIWDTEANDWAAGAWYTLADGTKAVKKFTYAMTRASLQDGAGANAIWNITNVTRSDRRYLYSTPAWAKAQAEDPEVISYIKQHGASATSLLHSYYAETETEIANKVETLLSMNTAAKGGENYTAAFGAPEMSDKDYYDFMVWHRGLAVPAARDLNDDAVKQGKKLFKQIGCEACHRPSWKTGADNYWVDNSIKAYAASAGLDANSILPRFPYQTIYPYTDMVQHRLFMKNDIRTGWCRTTPLWGRGLSLRLTGAQDRLHDCRARNEVEAIMWHAYSKDSDAYASAVKFYNLSKEERDAVVKFLQSI